MQELAGNCGSIVALEPDTGRVLVMASTPTYDPNLIERSFRRATRVPAPCTPASPLLNRATQGPVFIPGSTFKVVTAAAALDDARWSPESTFEDPGYCIEYGKRSPSGLYSKGKLFEPKDDNQVDPGRLAFGQERMLVTPLQMAMVSAAVANRGILMEPHLVDRIVSHDRDVITKTKPEEIRRVMKADTAAALAPMMVRVVESGTGTAAQVSGVSVAGKTGTAETGRANENDTGFIAFAPADAPRVAIAVFLQNQDGTGGSTAAPIAKTVLETLLRRTA
jgi:peptidoglycan glycosyltransferase